MKFLVLIYCDAELLEELPAEEFDRRMRGCIRHADELRAQGSLLDSQQLEPPATARTLRVRDGRSRIVEGPFAETRVVRAGLNRRAAQDMDEAMRIAATFPWARTGSIEVRPVHDFEAERLRVGA
jgi:hypothetical protein